MLLAHLRRDKLNRLFSTYPDGWPGLALLLLRLTLGSLAIIQGRLYFTSGAQGEFRWVTAALAIAVGSSLVVGFVTPASAVLLAAGTVSTALSWVRPPPVNMLEAKLVTLLVVIVAAAVAILGPGQLSIDARLFGRREIIIPHPSRTPKQ